MNQEGIQPMTRAVQGAGKWTTLSKYAEARADRCQKVAGETDKKQFMTHTKMMWQWGFQ